MDGGRADEGVGAVDGAHVGGGGVCHVGGGSANDEGFVDDGLGADGAGVEDADRGALGGAAEGHRGVCEGAAAIAVEAALAVF